MTEREMLAMAAKAAGNIWLINNANTGETYYGVCEVDGHFHGSAPQWNPLNDDGDALRLAVDLCLRVTHRTVDVDVTCGKHSCSEYTPNHPSAYAATRRAIVRVAAEIGRSKHE